MTIRHNMDIANHMVVADYFHSTTADYIFPRLVNRKKNVSKQYCYNEYISNLIYKSIGPEIRLWYRVPMYNL